MKGEGHLERPVLASTEPNTSKFEPQSPGVAKLQKHNVLGFTLAHPLKDTVVVFSWDGVPLRLACTEVVFNGGHFQFYHGFQS